MLGRSDLFLCRSSLLSVCHPPLFLNLALRMGDQTHLLSKVQLQLKALVKVMQVKTVLTIHTASKQKCLCQIYMYNQIKEECA